MAKQKRSREVQAKRRAKPPKKAARRRNYAPRPDTDPPDASPVNGVVPPAAHRWQPGQSGNPAGRSTAGATLREHINSLVEHTEPELRRIAKDKSITISRRAAAERILCTIEAGDLADFADVMTLRDLRTLREKHGVDTTIVKKLSPGEFGTTIELHDRAREDFNLVFDRTEGKPKQSVSVDGSLGMPAAVDFWTPLTSPLGDEEDETPPDPG